MANGLNGLNKLTSKLNSMGRDIPVKMERLQSGAIDAGYRKATQEVPVDTGELRSSITKNEGSLDVGAEHGVFIEYGTFKSPAQPFIRPAYEEMSNYIDKNLKDVMR